MSIASVVLLASTLLLAGWVIRLKRREKWRIRKVAEIKQLYARAYWEMQHGDREQAIRLYDRAEVMWRELGREISEAGTQPNGDQRKDQS